MHPTIQTQTICPVIQEFTPGTSISCDFSLYSVGGMLIDMIHLDKTITNASTNITIAYDFKRYYF